jgi:hypothetical protein
MPGNDVRFVAPAFENPQIDHALTLQPRSGLKIVAPKKAPV